VQAGQALTAEGSGGAAIDRGLAVLSAISAALASLIIVSMMLLICADIATRNLLSVPIHGVTDYVSYAIVACVYLQLGLTVRHDRLVRASFLSDWLEQRRPGAMLLLQTVFSLAAVAIMALAARYRGRISWAPGGMANTWARRPRCNCRPGRSNWRWPAPAS